MPEWFEKVTIGALLDRLVQRCGEREAFAFAGQRWSFRKRSQGHNPCNAQRMPLELPLKRQP